MLEKISERPLLWGQTYRDYCTHASLGTVSPESHVGHGELRAHQGKNSSHQPSAQTSTRTVVQPCGHCAPGPTHCSWWQIRVNEITSLQVQVFKKKKSDKYILKCKICYSCSADGWIRQSRLLPSAVWCWVTWSWETSPLNQPAPSGGCNSRSFMLLYKGGDLIFRNNLGLTVFLSLAPWFSYATVWT